MAKLVKTWIKVLIEIDQMLKKLGNHLTLAELPGKGNLS